MDDPASNLLAFLAEDVPHSPTLLSVLAKLFAVLFFVGANAFFVGAEFALVSVRRTRLETRAAAGSRRARAAVRLINDPSFFISSTQLGVTLASLALGWVGEPTLASLLEPLAEAIAPAGRAAYVAHILAIIIAFAVITFLHIVLGELMPKMFALERAESLALFVARPLELFAKVFRVPIWVFNRSGATLGRSIGLKSWLQHTSVQSELELRQLIDISRESGHLRAEERRLIHRVFEFSDTLVREAMVPRPQIAAISASCTLEEIVGEISDEHDEEVNEQITPLGERAYMLDGALAVRDLNRRLKTSLPESEGYTTIGGFLMSIAGHVLQPGEVIEDHGLCFVID